MGWADKWSMAVNGLGGYIAAGGSVCQMPQSRDGVSHVDELVG